MSRLVKQLRLVGKRQAAAAHWLTELAAAKPQTLHLRDGEVVVYRRSRSLLYQCRFKLADGTWHRQTTGKASVEHAIARACDLYDEARYRQRLGLAHQTDSFVEITGQFCLTGHSSSAVSFEKMLLPDSSMCGCAHVQAILVKIPVAGYPERKRDFSEFDPRPV